MIVSFYFFLLIVGLQILFWGLIFARLGLYKEQASPSSEGPPVSVIICAKNEADNLRQHLPKILSQRYTHFEVLVVNDGSTDQTAAVLQAFSEKWPKLRVLHLSREEKLGKGKKYALAKGIAAAKHENLLLTDADCYPSSEDWIACMVAKLKGPIQIVLGYGPYEQNKGFLNKFIQYETTHTAIQYLSFSLWGFPYMGVGRNLLYKKSLYLESQGFEAHQHIASGDDDLFINSAGSSSNTDICIDNRAFMFSSPKTHYNDYYVQKTRHFSTSKHYKIRNIFLLSIYSMSHITLLVAFILNVIFNIYGTTVLLLFLARTLLMLITYGNVLKHLNQTSLLKWVPLLDVTYVIYYLLFTPAVLRNKSRQWK